MKNFKQYIAEALPSLPGGVHSSQMYIINFDPKNGRVDGNLYLISVHAVRDGGNNKVADVIIVNTNSGAAAKEITQGKSKKHTIPLRPLDLPLKNINELKRSKKMGAIGIDWQRDKVFLMEIFPKV